MNNKGISIAINQVVLILIGIVILGLGLSFVAKIMMVAEHALPSIDSKLEDQLRNKLGRDNVVELTRSVQKIGAKDLAIFNLGILNDPRLSSMNEFTVILNYDKAINKAGVPICETSGSDDCVTKMKDAILVPDLTYVSSSYNTYKNTFNIKENELKIVSIGIVPKDNSQYAGTGQYFYNICVCEGNSCGTTCSSLNPPSNLYGFKTFSVIVE